MYSADDLMAVLLRKWGDKTRKATLQAHWIEKTLGTIVEPSTKFKQEMTMNITGGNFPALRK